MKELKQLIAINKLSQKNSKWIHRDIFRILNKDDIWIAAYEKLKGNKGAVTLESTPETMDGISLERLKKLKNSVCTEKYKFKSVLVKYIPRPDGRQRPLGLPTANDKIVQEVMRMILEAIYEPIFSELSFGFRSGLGCHDALDHVERKFRWVDFVIEGDITQAYPRIDHHILVQIINKRINDHRFIRLIWKLLGCGILENDMVITADVPPFKSFFIDRIIGEMKRKDLLDAENGKIQKNSIIDYVINKNGSDIREIIIKNYKEKERVNEIINTAGWSLTRMLENIKK